jgi:molecular chaperone HtpG
VFSQFLLVLLILLVVRADSDDLPLNVSREFLQQSKLLSVIRKNLVKKSLELLDCLYEGSDFFLFYSVFAKNIKLGIYDDSVVRVRLARFLRFPSSLSLSGSSFDEYIARSGAAQFDIYFGTGSSLDSVSSSPFMEWFTKYALEVLFRLDPIDEYCIGQLKSFSGRSIKSICLKIGEEYSSSSCLSILEALGDIVERVVFTDRLVIFPCVLVASEYSWSANLERIMSAQALRDVSMGMYMSARKSFHCNSSSLVILHLVSLLPYVGSDRLGLFLSLVFNITVLASGFSILCPCSFAKSLFLLLEYESVYVASLVNISVSLLDKSLELLESCK